MTKKMLINATQAEEIRLAVVEERHLQYLDLASSKRQQKKGNIYLAKISRIEQSLNAIFVSYGSDRHGFLPIKEIAPEYFHKPKNMDKTLALKDVLKEGQELIIQVQKEERGNKGAAVTTYITLPGTYVVLMPNTDKAGGVSRSVDGKDRSALKTALNKLKIPGDYGVIIRTAGLGRTQEALQSDLDLLVNLWHTILDISKKEKAPKLIYQETNILLRAVRDYLREDIAEIIIDNKKAHQELLEHIKRFRPDYIDRLSLYEQETPLFSRYQIERQIELAYQREIDLPSGGAIVIDHTEALTSIDVNSARATKGGDIEETALKTNIEAAKEIARQLCIRDLGGLVVIDFIDMSSTANKKKVEKTMQQAIKNDKARVQIGPISTFGLLEMSRQRIRPSLQESSHHVCPRCSGKGAIRSVESLGLSVIRHLRDTSVLPDTEELQVQLPVELASFLLNEKRSSVLLIEEQSNVKIVLVPNPYLETPEYKLTRIKANDEQEVVSLKSYRLVDKPEVAFTPEKSRQQEEPAIKSLSDVDTSVVKKPLGLFRKLYQSLFIADVAEDIAAPTQAASRPKQASAQRQKGQRSSHQGRDKPSTERNKQNRAASQRSKPAHRSRVDTAATKDKTQHQAQHTKHVADSAKGQNKEGTMAKSAKPQSTKPKNTKSQVSKNTNPVRRENAPEHKDITTPRAESGVMATPQQQDIADKPAVVRTEKAQTKKTSADNKMVASVEQAVADVKQEKTTAPRKKSTGNSVDEVLTRSVKTHRSEAKQVETTQPKSEAIPQVSKVESIVQTTQVTPKTQKGKTSSDKNREVITKANVTQATQTDNLSMDVATIGGSTKPKASTKKPRASQPKKSATKAKPTNKASVKKTPQKANDGTGDASGKTEGSQ